MGSLSTTFFLLLFCGFLMFHGIIQKTGGLFVFLSGGFNISTLCSYWWIDRTLRFYR